MANIFISYSRQSEAITKALVDDVEALGHTVWFDQELSGGQVWWDQILSMIRRCDLFVFALDPAALNSIACKREYSYAADLRKPILPILVSEGVSTNLLPPLLSQIQFVDYRHQNHTAALRLARAFGAIPPAAAVPDPLPVPPDVPISYLGSLAVKVETTSLLTYEEQSVLVFDLKKGLRDPETAVDTRTLLKTFRKRSDLLAGIAAEIDELFEGLGATSSASPRVSVGRPPSWEQSEKKETVSRLPEDELETENARRSVLEPGPPLTPTSVSPTTPSKSVRGWLMWGGVCVAIIAGSALGVTIWKNPALAKIALTVTRFHSDARKPTPPFYEGTLEVMRDLTTEVKEDITLENRQRPGYNAWAVAQMVVSLPKQDIVGTAEMSEWFQAQIGNSKSWGQFSSDCCEHFGATGWVLLAFARMNVSPQEQQIEFVLGNQRSSGSWPIWPASEATENASTYATAISAWALEELSRRELIPAQQKNATRQAIQNARDWLLRKTVLGKAGRWKDYPNGMYGIESIGVSGFALHVLHRTPGPAPTANDRFWMANLPSELPNLTEASSSGAPVETRCCIKNDPTHHYALPWLVIGTADAYSQGTLAQRAQAARLFYQVGQQRQAIARDLKDMPWLAAEMLLSLRELQRQGSTDDTLAPKEKQ